MRFRGSVWRDWVVVDWGSGHGKLPNKIWGFVDLSKLSNSRRINFGGVQLQPTVYAVVESALAVEDGEDTELLSVVETEVGEFSLDGYVSKLKLYLAPVEAFVEPAVVVPNIGGENNSYLWLTGRQNWRDLFVTWLHKPYQDLTEVSSEEESGLSEAEGDDYSEADSDDEAQEQAAVAVSDDEFDEDGEDD
jgi:hypothetical protein